MKRRTFAVVLVLLFVLIAVGVLGAVQILGSNGTLTELWVSDTARDAIGNHHAPAASQQLPLRFYSESKDNATTRPSP